jgi:hypothetical protein
MEDELWYITSTKLVVIEISLAIVFLRISVCVAPYKYAVALGGWCEVYTYGSVLKFCVLSEGANSSVTLSSKMPLRRLWACCLIIFKFENFCHLGSSVPSE